MILTIAVRDIQVMAGTALFMGLLWFLCAIVAAAAEGHDHTIKLSAALSMVAGAQVLIAVVLFMLATAPGLPR